MTDRSGEHLVVRQLIANLMRLSHTDLQDAQLLADAGSPRNAFLLLRNALSRIIEAVVASEQGHAGPAETGHINDQNPLKADLLRLDHLLTAPPALSPDGRLSGSPAAAALEEPFQTLHASLQCLTRFLGADLGGSGPADTAEPLRPAPPSLPMAQKPHGGPVAPKQDQQRSASTRPASNARTRAPKQTKEAAPPRPRQASGPQRNESSKPHASADLSSGLFWSLADRWDLEDLDALALVGHQGGLTKKGTRPRFRLKGTEAEVVAAMCSLDDALRQLGLNPAKWLVAPLHAEPFRGTSPLDVIQVRRMDGLRAVIRYVMQMGLRLSLQQA